MVLLIRSTKNGNLLNGKHHHQHHHHLEAKYLEYMWVKIILWWISFQYDDIVHYDFNPESKTE